VLQGAGEVIYSRKQSALRGSVKNVKHYYQAERERYAEMLASMRARWLRYLSNLETDIIEEKLEFILESLTFKFTRQPAALSLIPDRITEGNLRVASTVKLHSSAQSASQTGPAEAGSTDPSPTPGFYRDVYTDAERAQGLRSAVGSVLHAVTHADCRALAGPGEPSAQGRPSLAATASGPGSAGGKYTVAKHVCVASVEPAKRAKYQLVASVLYLIDFHLRKVNRRTELFVRAQAGLSREAAEREYDEVLDALLAGIRENYGDDEVNHVLDLVQLKRGGHDSLLEAVLRAKSERLVQARERRLAKREEEKRAKRRDGHLPIEALIRQEHGWSLERDAEEVAVLRKFLEARATQTMTGAEDD